MPIDEDFSAVKEIKQYREVLRNILQIIMQNPHEIPPDDAQRIFNLVHDVLGIE